MSECVCVHPQTCAYGKYFFHVFSNMGSEKMKQVTPFVLLATSLVFLQHERNETDSGLTEDYCLRLQLVDSQQSFPDISVSMFRLLAF